MIKIYNKNCRLALKSFPDNHFDTLITDPPYGLKFMGKNWDHGIPGVEYWKEFLRVCKPGAMALVFGGTRTFHRLTCAIEDAGWEIRDCMMWLYGSGFPKSHNIGKAIDKLRGNERKNIGEKQHAKKDFRSNLYAQDPANRNNEKVFGYGSEILTQGQPEWEGWGSCLKPAWEPIVLAMKPLDGTFAQNAEKHGVAGLWIDGGRIETTGKDKEKHLKEWDRFQSKSAEEGRNAMHGGLKAKRLDEFAKEGRWPANLILDEKAGKMLDEQTGSLGKSQGGRSGHTAAYQGGYKQEYYGDMKPGFGDSGGASRFFYCAKANKKERGKDNKHPTVKPLALMEYLCKLTKAPMGGIVLDPFAGSGTTGLACIKTGRDCVMFEKSIPSFKIMKARIKGAKE